MRDPVLPLHLQLRAFITMVPLASSARLHSFDEGSASGFFPTRQDLPAVSERIVWEWPFVIG